MKACLPVRFLSLETVAVPGLPGETSAELSRFEALIRFRLRLITEPPNPNSEATRFSIG